MSHQVAGARGSVKDRDAVLREAQVWASARKSEILLADASAVFGRDHLESAALHAERAQRSGNMATRSISMESLLYLAGQRQVVDAIRIAGIEDDTQAVALLVFGGAPVDELLGLLGWSRDDGVLDAGDKDMGLLGVSPAERLTVPAERIADLALERTALVDVTK
jgi:KEOPS complex subunit Cgi121